ncbi:MAG: Slp family lipoprotein [Xanthomonadales bacterium]|nr:Slp family lipoprotein [Xanthomonadales bacterium]
MNIKNLKLLFITAASGVLLSACVTIPEPLLGEFSVNEPQEASNLRQNQQIRWGGVIIAIKPEANSTCMEVLGKPLDSSQRPLNQDGTIGRFIACKDQFMDPEVLKEGREVTVTGPIRQIEEREIGEYIYAYPIIDASNIYLWPEREERVFYNTGGLYYWPYYSPYIHHPYRHHRR